MHLPHHQEMIRNASKHGGMDRVMRIIKKENPDVFHTASTLSERVFVHKPSTDVPHRECRTDKDVAGLYARDKHVKRLGNLPELGAGIEATDEAAALA